MIRKVAGILIFALLLIGLATQAQAITLDEIKDRGYVKVGMYPQLPPFTTRDENGNLDGFDVDVINEVAKMWEVDVRLVTIDTWAKQIPGLVNRKYDIFIAPFTITPKRAKLILFSQPHFNGGQVIVVKSNNRSIKSLADLRGKKVSAQKGSTCEDLVYQKIPNCIPAIIPDQDEVVKSVIKGVNDAYIIDRPIALGEIKKYRRKIKIVGDPITTEFYGYGLNKNDTELLMQLNQAITILRENGTWDKIFKKWF